MEQERACAYWLCCIPGIGNRTIEKLLELAGSPSEIYRGGVKLWKQVLDRRQLEQIKLFSEQFEPQRLYGKMLKDRIMFILRQDPEYPKRLREIPDPPYALFVKGALPKDEQLSVAVIGARECSEYGRFVAKELGRALGESRVQVVSGMARGIDGISQEAALDAGGASFGVLGCGVDVCYPASNRMLYERLRAQGGLISAYPPGTQARAQNFPPRNRIVSGLADVVVVVEARVKSGTLITVDMALEQGKDVYVVPGRVTDRLSDGCNRLLAQGAGVFLSPQDFLQEIGEKCGIRQETKTRQAGYELDALPPPMQKIYGVLDFSPQSPEQILEKLPEKYEYTVPKLAAVLMRLCVEGLAVQVSPGQFCRKQP